MNYTFIYISVFVQLSSCNSKPYLCGIITNTCKCEIMYTHDKVNEYRTGRTCCTRAQIIARQTAGISATIIRYHCDLARAHINNTAMMWQVIIFAAVTFACGCCATAPCYDHQNVTYKATFEPAACDATCTVTPFFSPDTSMTTYLDLIESATEAIDIFTPGKSIRRYKIHVRTRVFSPIPYCASERVCEQ